MAEFEKFKQAILKETFNRYLLTKDKEFLNFFHSLILEQDINSLDELNFMFEDTKPPNIIEDDKPKRSTIYSRLNEPLTRRDFNRFMEEVDILIEESKNKKYHKDKYPEEILERRKSILPKYVGNVFEYRGGRISLQDEHGLCIDLFPFKDRNDAYRLYLRIFIFETGKITSWSETGAELSNTSLKEFITKNYFK